MKPNTPLPWAANELLEKPEDKAFAIHAANAYPGLVDALQAACEVADCYPQFAKYGTRWRQMLVQLGEDVPEGFE